jgi:hypothetical protein
MANVDALRDEERSFKGGHGTLHNALSFGTFPKVRHTRAGGAGTFYKGVDTFCKGMQTFLRGVCTLVQGACTF